MESYGELRECLLSMTDRLKRTAGQNIGKLQEIEHKLRDQEFNLVILGQFKRGKSTFINALIGESILPTAIVPLTSVVTILRYGEKVRVVVHYMDGHCEDIELAKLPEFFTERANPRNRKGVKEVEVFYPSDYLKDGVRIIDTPGVGSVYRHNTEVAYSYLPYVDAAIFIVSADPPLSDSEHQFLRDIRSFVGKLFFIQNKIDQVSEADRKESLDFTLGVAS